MKKEIVILSDLWGRNNSEWLKNFEKHLATSYKITFYDCCELGGIDLSDYQQDVIHQQFIDFGIQNAVQKLLDLEKEPKLFLGCSIGGVIAWKAGLLGLNIQKLILISSTRLRKEKEKPDCQIQLYFGEHDEYKPSLEWLKSIACDFEIIKEGKHDIYKNELIVAKILEILN